MNKHEAAWIVERVSGEMMLMIMQRVLEECGPNDTSIVMESAIADHLSARLRRDLAVAPLNFEQEESA